MPERRYTDEEVEKILSDAAASERARVRDGDHSRGMTLSEIQRIAAEAQLDVAAVSSAAAALERQQSPVPVPRVLGIPSGVAHSVPLSRALNDAEWRRLVSVLRDTFHAQGTEAVVEGRREWRNGNLRISVESAGSGATLEMRTHKETARALVSGGAALLAMSGVTAAALAAASANPKTLAGVLLMAFGGVAMTAAGALQLPFWASARKKQFAAIAEYARQLAGSGLSDPRAP